MGLGGTQPDRDIVEHRAAAHVGIAFIDGGVGIGGGISLRVEGLVRARLLRARDPPRRFLTTPPSA